MVLWPYGFLILWRRYCPRGISELHLLHKTMQDSSAAGFSLELLAHASRLLSKENVKTLFSIYKEIIAKACLNLELKIVL